ncbi:hypothetical protein PUNSTDRAFT_138600 [Punctularia strigosozonata HHB-11173 SS5]|uniref:Uncharacterized protein n=1 Tax=Punctularia strigosozonata (strain HHB-11173) TaxID=741275 RepID=R7S5B2_PUNST|nr:uncharacterized protein PUNSTDRAFT_138600 [Punctularia strigosozonata HHB-11173 SS5]EIN04556.1 hypothetical protein PUNSTDRAFT_138600 [Punctularia strigosozonata HHB-11173 SS5]
MASEPYITPERPELLQTPDYIHTKESLLQNWNGAYLHSYGGGFPDVTFASGPSKWSIYRSGEFRRPRAEPSPVKTRLPVLAEVERVSDRGREIMTITRIARSAKIYVNGQSLELDVPFPLSENAIVLIDGLKYAYRSLEKVHAPSQYGLVKSQVAIGGQGGE